MVGFWIMLGGVALNVALNYMLIFGNLGFPRLELIGAGVATFISRMTILFLILYYINKSKKLFPAFQKSGCCRLNKEKIISLIKVGLPSAGQLTIAFGSFSITALLIGQFGNTALAAHQIALTYGTDFYVSSWYWDGCIHKSRAQYWWQSCDNLLPYNLECTYYFNFNNRHL